MIAKTYYGTVARDLYEGFVTSDKDRTLKSIVGQDREGNVNYLKCVAIVGNFALVYTFDLVSRQPIELVISLDIAGSIGSLTLAVVNYKPDAVSLGCYLHLKLPSEQF